MIPLVRLIIGLGIGLLAYQQSLACSSCGSGAADPIILFPNENYKFYLGLSDQRGFRDYNADGELVDSFGPDVKQRLTLSGGLRLSAAMTLSLTSGWQRNTKGNREDSGQTDPLFAWRYNIISQSFTSPLRPQVQVVASHKLAVGRSIHDSSALNMIDVFGSGFKESSAGVDLWFGNLPFKFGGTVLYTHVHDARHNDTQLQPGARWTRILTLGTVAWNTKFIGGLIAMDQGGIKDDGQRVARSDRYQRDLFVTIETLSLPWGNLRLNLVRQGMFEPGKNSIQAQSLTISYMRGFL
ncbi:hypothetical protein [Pseudobacteriovorax antillogorgiicola]|uniref:MetA-pathway of phenol degradation n=1 Tax=Pseudobacteriovorax antillogorgiicola TaxID=1513793 RepID=A0A1Y6BTZ0_9BACT|nr:hypothetical protein [Pseudobacteriovorax antillogorgiicola]TCS52436.1 hypothetical protein EDD56_109181 [Pseudobacteriovorax antillogorgiicola]SMF28696.1 hypothetical protein SAMN06296036_10932 [Pseudobacteriovorax antillogorgiicola]